MMIRREDLVAAASVGLLQYRQIDPLLIFLLQREVRAKRQALSAQVRQSRRNRIYVLLSYLAVLLAVVTATLFATLFITRAVQSSGVGALFFFTAVYAIGALALAAWFKRRGHGGRLRALLALVVASVPIAVFALQQITV